MKKSTTFILLIAIILMLTFIITACDDDENNNDPSAGRAPGQSGESIGEQATITTELTVWGMTCNRCVSKITNALEDLDGVIDVTANFRTDIVTIVHKPDTDIAMIEDIIVAEGFNIP